MHVVVQFPGPAQLSARDEVGEGFLMLLKHGKSSSFTG